MIMYIKLNTLLVAVILTAVVRSLISGGHMGAAISIGLMLFIILLAWLYWAEFTKPKLLKAKSWVISKYTTIKNDIKVSKLWDKQD